MNIYFLKHTTTFIITSIITHINTDNTLFRIMKYLNMQQDYL